MIDTRWCKLGRILAPNPEVPWMATYTGPSFASYTGVGDRYDLYITGRDQRNRSIIGRATIALSDPIGTVQVDMNPVLVPGELGAFDENGVSYPWIVRDSSRLLMYYVGWMPSVLTPFQNHIGLAVSDVETKLFARASRAPILPRTNAEPFCSGSLCVIKEDCWKMWYTSFQRWGSGPAEHKHYYVIKYAESDNGVDWRRDGVVCIDFASDDEYAIGKPSVLRMSDGYHMWYVYRGRKYRIGYAFSVDGKEWVRNDEGAGIELSSDGWDSVDISYPHVFWHGENLYMLYCGNEYGKAGLGIARLSAPGANHD